MEALARLRARLRTLSELGDIVIAMRAIAAAALQEGRQALPAIERYAELIESGIYDVAAMLDATTEPAVRSQNGEAETICVIGSEHGFVGDLNGELLDQINIPQRSQVIVVGRRLQKTAEERGLTIAAALPMTTHVASVPFLARKLAETVGAATRVRIATVKHDAKTATVQAEVRQVLPVILPELGTRAYPSPLHQLAPRELLTELAGEYLLAEISRGLVEALTEESQVRLGVLGAASQNITDKLEDLRRSENMLRQETITTELLDVVVGAEAVIESETR